MDQRRAPLFEKLVNTTQLNRASFHVPGHKFGQHLDSQDSQDSQDSSHLNSLHHNVHSEESFYYKQIMSLDFTEISGLDDLHQPHGVIKEAQRLAAECFKAEESFFLINGSTVGNIALILSVCQRDDILIVERNVHKSILHGIMLACARVVFLSPRWDEQNGIPTGVDYNDLQVALEKYPQAKAVLLTNPNYYGMGIDLAPITQLTHAHNKPLLVDEAHGAHYGFHSKIPRSALSYGADAVVQSTHKMLTSLTMGAMLHIQGDRMDRNRLQQSLSMLQSSSPSYPIMASLDLSRRLMATEGERRISSSLVHILHFRSKLTELSEFIMIGNSSLAHDTQDPYKAAIRDATGTLSGYQLQQQLELRGCIAEMADPHFVVLAFSLCTTKKDSEKLFHAFLDISKQFSLKKQELCHGITNSIKLPRYNPKATPVSLNLQHLQDTILKQTVPLKEAAQARSAEMIIPYPPGIPVLYPGEWITSEMVEYLLQLSSLGATFQGTTEVHLQRLEVYKTADHKAQGGVK